MFFQIFTFKLFILSPPLCKHLLNKKIIRIFNKQYNKENGFPKYRRRNSRSKNYFYTKKMGKK